VKLPILYTGCFLFNNKWLVNGSFLVVFYY
jgi:hypothetical protein